MKKPQLAEAELRAELDRRTTLVTPEAQAARPGERLVGEFTVRIFAPDAATATSYVEKRVVVSGVHSGRIVESRSPTPVWAILRAMARLGRENVDAGTPVPIPPEWAEGREP